MDTKEILSGLTIHNMIRRIRPFSRSPGLVKSFTEALEKYLNEGMCDKWVYRGYLNTMSGVASRVPDSKSLIDAFTTNNNFKIVMAYMIRFHDVSMSLHIFDKYKDLVSFDVFYTILLTTNSSSIELIRTIVDYCLVKVRTKNIILKRSNSKVWMDIYLKYPDIFKIISGDLLIFKNNMDLFLDQVGIVTAGGHQPTGLEDDQLLRVLGEYL
jgi:hypothetical protein